MRPLFSRTLVPASLASVILFTGCNTPVSVADFCSSANSSLTSGSVIWQDLQGSCLRDEAAAMPFTEFKPNKPQDPSAACNVYPPQVEGLQAATKVLADYFVAMNSLASFGTAQLGTSAGALAQTVATKASLQPNEVNAVQALATVVTHLVATGYQTKHLDADLKEADPQVKAITAALERVVNLNYLPLLNHEQADMSFRYQKFLADNPCPGRPDHNCHLETLIVLQDRWQGDLKSLAAKRQAAAAFVSALDTIAEGHAALAANADRLKAQQLPGLLAPYSDELKTLARALIALT